ncbi:hypothetical protein O181_094399 [Austropuccinia psidii MF-1]|uniref:Uncharacterized protein n=1 Tax=Austropuccinia psidii MF-1 TaxID=1389203 RepID=A0A9Q3J340_9BASI|nr:hypothetical protein [Austropuccinia psidii MF-1]
MPIQNSTPERNTRSEARTQAVLTPTTRAPLDGTPAVLQMRAKLNRGPILEREASSRKERRGPTRSISFSGVVGAFPGTSRTIFRRCSCSCGGIPRNWRTNYSPVSSV